MYLVPSSFLPTSLPLPTFFLPPDPLPLQSKPLIELQVDRDAKGNRVLTCVFFPQRDSDRPHSPTVKIAGTANAYSILRLAS